MPERSHLSIGEVLSLLREEFPDVTISKIRFLESQGLVDPERTPSGYRKFYDQDVERLRWILRQQREHFLPLKVIRGRLSEGGSGEANGTASHPSRTSRPQPDDRGEAPHLPGLDPVAMAPPAAPQLEQPETQDPAVTEVGSHPPQSRQEVTSGPRPQTPAATEPASPASPRPAAAQPSQQPGPMVATAAPEAVAHLGTAARAQPPRTAPEPTPEPAPPRPAHSAQSGHLGSDNHDSFSADELVAAAGATPELVNELKQYGLIAVHAVVGGTPYFDESALAVTRAAVGFARHGVEARHLRAWRNSADREAALFEQLIMPLLRQRNPQARRQAAETVADLSRLGGELREALVQRALREIR